MKLNFTQFEELFDEAEENNQAFALDWKSSIEDVVYNVKIVCPNLQIRALPEKQVYGDWVETMIIDESEYPFQTESDTLILDAISAVNKHLQKSNQALVFYDTEDDNKYFILISLSEIPEYLEKGFIEL